MKDKNRIFEESKKVSQIGLYTINIFIAINQWPSGVVRYSAGIVDWTGGDLELFDRKKRKILTCGGLFHLHANAARLYLKRCKGGSRLSECN